MRGRKNRPVGTTPSQRAWSQSPQAAEQRLLASQQAAAARAAAPKCGATRKSDRQPCENPGLENGRCRLHGGATPRGADWHKVQMPGRGAPIAKLERKLRKIALRRAEQAARVAAMTPEERARYEAWQRTHKPGTPAEREQRRRDRELAAAFNTPPAAPAPDPEQDKLAADIAELKQRKAALEELCREQQATEEDSTNDR